MADRKKTSHPAGDATRQYLGTDLVAALASLQVNDFPHLEWIADGRDCRDV